MLEDFVTLANTPIPQLSFYQKYRIKCTSNLLEGKDCELYNVPIHELAHYAMKSISNGVSVWFVGDVHNSFNYFHSALDDQLDDHKTVFKQFHSFDKGDRIYLKNVQGCHAMALTGFNTDEKGCPKSWQVENSWGYADHEIPGRDGFLFMSHSWFEKYVTQIVVMKKFLSRSFKKKLDKSVPIDLDPWDSVSPALKATVVNPPQKYIQYINDQTNMLRLRP